MVEIILERLLQIGKIPICNGMASRALHIGNFCFILCYRCSGVVLGIIFVLYYLNKHKPKIHYFLLIVPMIVDGFLQLLTPYTSNNLLRLITGMLFGIVIGHGIIYFSNKIYDAVF